jgi:hypothetical protein
MTNAQIFKSFDYRKDRSLCIIPLFEQFLKLANKLSQDEIRINIQFLIEKSGNL